MPSLISRFLKIDIAQHFYESFESVTDVYYLFIGKGTAWASTPDIPNNSIKDLNFKVWDRILALKKITNTDVSFVIPRFNWVSGNVYRKYKSYENIFDNQSISNGMYVTTADFKVYKCIDNNKGATVSEEPSQTDLVNTFKTSDGYEWKYMYPIVGSEQQKFLSSEYIPIKNIAVSSSFNSDQFIIQGAAIDGTVDTIDVIAGGTDYISFKGYISEYGNTSVIYVANTEYGANRINDDYYNGCSLYVEKGAGRGQLVEILDYDAASAKLTIAGIFTTALKASNIIDKSLINIGPKITVKTDGNDVTAYANVNILEANSVNYINMVTKGTLSTEGIVIIQDSSYAGAIGSGAVGAINVSPSGGHGSSPLYELGTGAIMISSKFRGNENIDILNDNDFGTYGIIHNPTYSNNNVLIDTTLDNTIKLNVTGVVNMTNSTPLAGWSIEGQTTFGTANAISFTTSVGSNGVLVISEPVAANGSAITSGEIVVLNADVGTYATVDTITVSTAKQNSGRVIYIENREIIRRAPEQSEDFKIVLQF